MRSSPTLLALGLACLVGCNRDPAKPPAEEKKPAQVSGLTLTFGVYATDVPTEMHRQFRPVLDILEKELSTRFKKPVTVEMKITAKYEDGIRDLVEGKVDFSRFGPESYVHAKGKNSGIKLLAMELEKGKKSFFGLICVHKNSSVKKVEELRGKSFAFGDYGSTIGRLLAVKYLVEGGLAEKDLARWEYLGRHDKVGVAVALEQFDAGALNEKTFQRLVKEGKAIRELARFENVTKPWIARAELDDETFTALQQTLLPIRDAEALGALGFDGFAETSDADYAVIRQALKLTEGRFPLPAAKDPS